MRIFIEFRDFKEIKKIKLSYSFSEMFFFGEFFLYLESSGVHDLLGSSSIIIS